MNFARVVNKHLGLFDFFFFPLPLVTGQMTVPGMSKGHGPPLVRRPGARRGGDGER